MSSDGTTIVGFGDIGADVTPSVTTVVNGLASVRKVGQFGNSAGWGRPASCSGDGRTIVGYAVVNGESSLFVNVDAPDALSQVLA